MGRSKFFSTVGLLLTMAAGLAMAQPGPGGGGGAAPIRSLKTVPVPEPIGLNEYVRDRNALVALGKAFFWDMQAGSDGRTACATCHFHAGADMRPRNQMVDPNNPFAVNQDLTKVAFPLRRLADPNNRNSVVLADSSVRIGSAGTFRRTFEDVTPGQAAELGADAFDKPEFIKGDLQVRRVTVRNSPSVINAVFYQRGFWDGRANRVFNGATVTGIASEAPGALVWRDGLLRREPVRIDNATLASQAVGPVLDHLEMSYAGRSWAKLGQKMLSLPPLAFQRVSVDDSVLGPLARGGNLPGLQPQHTYLTMIQAAFEPRYWESIQMVNESGEPMSASASARGFTQAEVNFPLFWGLALQAYQATLVSNDAPFDRFADGDNAALSAQEREGLQIFQNQGRCNTCHGVPEFSNATGGNRPNAFERTGVRPVSEDAGAGNGQFKSVSLRNVELTGPYFHNGGAATLEQAVEFYIRGGDFNPGNDIRPFNVSPGQKAALVAFLKSLTDDRVRYERAPFDHPELCVPTGHPETEDGALLAGEIAPFWRSAAETWTAIRAVGAAGNAVPLRTFEEMLRGVGADGSRAHAAGEACTAALP